jgi:hypothetical protein
MTGNENFESRLLNELRQVAPEAPAPSSASARRKPYGRFALAGTGLAAAVAAIAIYAGTGSNTPNAYAVETKPDGMVTVEIKSLKDADGLESSLRAAGVPADVNYSPAPTTVCSGPGGRSAEAGLTVQKGEDGPSDGGPTFHTEGVAPAGGLPTTSGSASAPASGMAMKGKDGTFMSTRTDAGGTTFSVDPGNIKPGEKLYITTSAPGGAAQLDHADAPTSVAISIGDKPVAPGC